MFYLFHLDIGDFYIFFRCVNIVCFLLFFLLPTVPRSFANQCKNPSHTRESLTDKASCLIGKDAKKKQPVRINRQNHLPVSKKSDCFVQISTYRSYKKVTLRTCTSQRIMCRLTCHDLNHIVQNLKRLK